MSFLTVAALTAMIVLIGVVLTCAVCLDRDRLALVPATYRTRFVAVAPFLAATALFSASSG